MHAPAMRVFPQSLGSHRRLGMFTRGEGDDAASYYSNRPLDPDAGRREPSLTAGTDKEAE